MTEMDTRSIQTVIDRLREICNELICAKKRSMCFDIFSREAIVWHLFPKASIEGGIQALLNVACGLGGCRAQLYHFTKRGQ